MAARRGDGDSEGAEGAAARSGFLPRSTLSLSNRALIDYNILVFARALANLFAVRFGFATGLVTDEAAVRVPGKAGTPSVGSSSVAGSYGGLPLSSSLSKSLGPGSYMARGLGSPEGAGATAATAGRR